MTKPMGVLGFCGGAKIFVQRPLGGVIVDIGAYDIKGSFIADNVVVITALPEF